MFPVTLSTVSKTEELLRHFFLLIICHENFAEASVLETQSIERSTRLAGGGGTLATLTSISGKFRNRNEPSLMGSCFPNKREPPALPKFSIFEEDVRFELTDPEGPPIFKTGAIDRSANPPYSNFL